MIKLLSLVVRLLTGLQKKHAPDDTSTPLRVDLHSEIRLPAPIVDLSQSGAGRPKSKTSLDKYKVGFEIRGHSCVRPSLTFFT